MDETKMKLPKLRMCCFCIPLRGALLSWGYINLVYHTVLLALIACLAFMVWLAFAMGGKYAPLELTVLLPLLVFWICSYSLVIIIAGHTLNPRLLRGAFIAGAILWIFEVLYSPCLASRIIKLIVKDEFPGDSAMLGFFFVITILEPFLQGYVLFVIRSVMLQLEDEGNIEYVNLNKNEVEKAPRTTDFTQCLIMHK